MTDEDDSVTTPDEPPADPTDGAGATADEAVTAPGEGDGSADSADGSDGSGKPLDDGDPEYRSLHPLTAVIDAGQTGFNGGAFGFFLGAIGGGAAGVLPFESVFVLAPLGFLLGAGYGVASYAVFEYRLGGSALHITSGVFQRQNREIPLRRVQNVDVHQTFVGRLLGLASVRLETAGGGQTEAELRFVAREEADRLQREIRRRKRSDAGQRRAAAGDAPAGRATTGEEVTDEEAVTGESPGEPEETVLFELSMQELLVLSGVSFRWGVLFPLVFGLPLVSDFLVSLTADLLGDGPASAGDPLMLALGLAGLVGLLLVSWVVSAALTFVRYFDFRLARIDDELVYERGLLQRYSGSIPLDKVQTLTIRENPLMRRLGYAALMVETAGYTPGQGRGNGQQVPSAVPLADREAVEDFATELEGVEDFSVERPPKRARQRYAIRYGMLTVALTAVLFAVDRLSVDLPWYVAVVGLALAPVAAHLKWTNRGFGVGDSHLVTRTGFWRRNTQLVPYYRIQTVVTERTYFQRRWRIASVVADTASSAVVWSRHPTAYDVDEDRAEHLHETLRERLRESLRQRRAGRSDGGPENQDDSGGGHPADDESADRDGTTPDGG
ncbi:hypothetical protein BRC81_05955 [Halobacteriales archaeon QS_1_68_20]|nr:MAG: hypothetical protein BRC81_05955 [Halobacteriales archaeon QS_1_68_20]